MKSVIRFLKNVWILLFDPNTLYRNRALKAIFPAVWLSVWNTGWDRCHENMRYTHERDIADMNAQLARLRKQVNQRGEGGRFVKKNAS